MKTHKPTVYADFMKASRQEKEWAKTAKAEAEDESKRSSLWKRRGYKKFAKELKWDSGIALSFYVMRKERSRNYRKLAQKAKESE